MKKARPRSVMARFRMFRRAGLGGKRARIEACRVFGISRTTFYRYRRALRSPS